MLLIVEELGTFGGTVDYFRYLDCREYVAVFDEKRVIDLLLVDRFLAGFSKRGS